MLPGMNCSFWGFDRFNFSKYCLTFCHLQAMGKNSFYLGEVGNATKMNLVLQVCCNSKDSYFQLNSASTQKLTTEEHGEYSINKH